MIIHSTQVTLPTMPSEHIVYKSLKMLHEKVPIQPKWDNNRDKTFLGFLKIINYYYLESQTGRDLFIFIANN